MKRTIINIFVFVFSTCFLHAQIALDSENSDFLDNISEKVVLYSDRDLYLSGEELWFSAFVVVNNTFMEFELSKIVYLELLNRNNKILFKGKFMIENGIASGSFKIPEEALTSNCFLYAYTQYQRNFPPELISAIPITIINPEYSLPQQEQTNDTLINNNADWRISQQASNKDVKVIIKSNKTVYNKRDYVEMDFQTNGLQANELAEICVSVIKRGTHTNQEVFTSISENTTDKKRLDSLFWIPETRGISISGTALEKKTSKPLEGINIYLSVLGDKPRIHIAQTRENGEFIFPLGNLTGTQMLYIGVKDDNHQGVQIMVYNDFPNDIINIQKTPLSIDSTYKNLIEEMLVNYQSQKIFAPYEETSPEFDQGDSKIFGKPEISVNLSDYILLPDLETIFFELIPTVSIKKKSDQKLLYITDPSTGWSFKNQLLLLDYVPVFDLNAVLSLSPAKIEQIEAINSNYYLGDNTLRNVLMINTKAKDFAGYIFPEGSTFIEFETITPSKTFKTPVYKSQKEKNSSIPDFRTLLYWNPKLLLSNDNTTISFYTSDNTGDYDIIVRGLTKKGKVCFGKGSIRF